MTAPRHILANVAYLITRRATQREFLLKPGPLTNLIFKFVLAVAAARYGVLVHAVCVMSNHYHLVLTDPLCQLPEFQQFLDGVLARALNSFLGRKENFWAPSSYSAVTLVTNADIVEKTAYTLANPAAADLVEKGRQWPGVWTDPRHIGGAGETVERPGQFFSEGGAMPESAVLVVSAPPGFESVEAFRAQVIARLRELEEQAAAARKKAGTAVLGARRVRKQKHTDRPVTPEPGGHLNPRIACRDGEKRVEALARLADFLKQYRAALERYRAKKRAVLFPHGTYLMRVRFGVACASS